MKLDCHIIQIKKAVALNKKLGIRILQKHGMVRQNLLDVFELHNHPSLKSKQKGVGSLHHNRTFFFGFETLNFEHFFTALSSGDWLSYSFLAISCPPVPFRFLLILSTLLAAHALCASLFSFVSLLHLMFLSRKSHGIPGWMRGTVIRQVG